MLQRGGLGKRAHLREKAERVSIAWSTLWDAGGGSQPGASQRWLHLPGRPRKTAGDASAAGAARGGGRQGGGWGGGGGQWRGGRGNEPPAAVTEALTFTPAPATAPFRASWNVWETQPPSPPHPSPRLIKSLAVGRYFHIQAGQNRNADQLL